MREKKTKKYCIETFYVPKVEWLPMNKQTLLYIDKNFGCH